MSRRKKPLSYTFQRQLMKLTGNITGLVGWRGMVGSVLIDRMQAEGDF